jgi:hypothetical protein
MSLHYDDLVGDFHRDYLLIRMDPDVPVCPIPNTYVGMCSPALGPAVLRYGNDVAIRPRQDLPRSDSVVWPLIHV